MRVIDRGRVGSHRTGAADPGDLDNAVRAAIAQSRVREPLPGLPHLPAPDDAAHAAAAPANGPAHQRQAGGGGGGAAGGEPTQARPDPAALHDRVLAELDERAAHQLLDRLRRSGDSVRLDWCEARVAVFNSRGMRRTTSVTAAAAAVRSGRGAGCGRAADAARSLDDLKLAELFDRARGRRAPRDAAAGELPDSGPQLVVLSPEATGRLCDLLNRTALSAASYYRGESFLREHLGVQVFDRNVSLRDDATDPAGLPFPFDLEGSLKRPVDLVVAGTPKTPALDQRQAAVLGLAPTAHAIGGADARAENLFLLPGPHSDVELLEAAEGGIWACWIEPLECFEPRRIQLRAVLRGARRIAGGRLGAPLPDLVWEASLLRAFAHLEGIGAAASRRPSRDGYLGALSTPALALRAQPAELRVRE